MRIKDLLKAMFYAYFVITTGAAVSMYISCLLFNPKGSFSPVDIGGILLVALVSDLTFFIFYSNKELSKKQMIFRFFIHIPTLLIILLYFAHLFKWVNIKSFIQVVVFILLVLGVYAGTLLISFYKDKKIADQLNDSLKKRYDT